jgi:hypothetical protein
MSPDSKLYLESLHTVYLLRILARVRTKGIGWDRKLGEDEYTDGGVLPADVTVEDLKSILATRPHIPNKKERAAIRKQKMHERQNR